MSRRVKDLYFYELLGLTSSATDDDIKRAYRKLAIKWHPDKNIDNRQEATEMFQLIAEAYATLIDPQKRVQYDMYGRDSVQFDDDDQSMNDNTTSSTSSGMNNPSAAFHHHFHAHPHVSLHFADNLFRMFFGGHDPFGNLHNNIGNPSNVHNSNMRSPFSSMMNMDPFGSFGGGGFGGLGGGFGMMPTMMMGHSTSLIDPFHNFNTGPSLFNNALMTGNMFSSSSSSTSSSFGPGGTSTSISTVSTIENGKRVTRTTKTIRHADGRVEQTSDENIQDISPPNNNNRLQNSTNNFSQPQIGYSTMNNQQPPSLQRHDSFGLTNYPSSSSSSYTPQYTSTVQHQQSLHNQGGQPFSNTSTFRTTSNNSGNNQSFNVPVTLRTSAPSYQPSSSSSSSSPTNQQYHSSSNAYPGSSSSYPRR